MIKVQFQIFDVLTEVLVPYDQEFELPAIPQIGHVVDLMEKPGALYKVQHVQWTLDARHRFPRGPTVEIVLTPMTSSSSRN